MEDRKHTKLRRGQLVNLMWLQSPWINSSPSLHFPQQSLPHLVHSGLDLLFIYSVSGSVTIHYQESNWQGYDVNILFILQLIP